MPNYIRAPNPFHFILHSYSYKIKALPHPSLSLSLSAFDFFEDASRCADVELPRMC